ncbi:MAG: hypothetical protein PVH17_01510 [Anaerolineae bacterium]|jgi:hypothetical protein
MRRRAKRLSLLVTFLLLIVGTGLPVRATGPGATASRTAGSTAATPVVSPDIPIYVSDEVQTLPDVAYNWKHDEYLVVWETSWSTGERDIWGRRISGHGELLDAFPIGYGSNHQSQPSVAYDPEYDRYLIVWQYDYYGDGSDYDINGRFVPWDGPDPSLVEFFICNWGSDQWWPRIVYNENPDWDEFLVIWYNSALYNPYTVSGRRVYADGGGFPDSAFPIADHATEDRRDPDVAYNLARNEYLVTYSDESDIYATRLEANGNALGGGEFNVATWPDPETEPAVAACHTANQYFVAWQSDQGTHWDIYGRFVDGTGTVANVLHISENTLWETLPAIACNPAAGKYLVVWEQEYNNLSGSSGIGGRLVFTDMTQGTQFEIVGPSDDNSRVQPAVAAGQPDYLVPWTHQRPRTSWSKYLDIHGRLVWPGLVYLPLLLRNG